VIARRWNKSTLTSSFVLVLRSSREVHYKFSSKLGARSDNAIPQTVALVAQQVENCFNYISLPINGTVYWTSTGLSVRNKIIIQTSTRYDWRVDCSLQLTSCAIGLSVTIIVGAHAGGDGYVHARNGTSETNISDHWVSSTEGRVTDGITGIYCGFRNVGGDNRGGRDRR